MTKEEEEALIEMFTKLATMKNTYMNIIRTAQAGVVSIVKNMGVSQQKMDKLREEGEQRAKTVIKKGDK